MDDKEPDTKRMVLTARQCLVSMLVGLGGVLFCSLIGLYQYHTKDASTGLFWFLIAMANVLGTLWEWRRYLAVQKGAIIYARQATQNSVASWQDQFVTVDSVLSLTILALFFSGSCAWAWMQQLTLPAGAWLIFLTLNGVLWILVFTCWYRLLSRRLRPKTIAESESQEDVWPPPPMRPR